MAKKKSILIVDDENEILELMTMTLEEANFRIVSSNDGVDASFKLKNEEFDLLITDLHMPKKTGAKLIEEIHTEGQNPNLPILVITGDLDSYKTNLATSKNVHVLEKPFDLDVLLDTVVKIFDPKKIVADEAEKNKKTVAKDEILIKAGEDANEMYWVIRGIFKAYKEVDGKKIDLGTIAQGELIGEMAFIDSQKRSASVVALEESEVLIIPPVKFTKVIQAQPQWFKDLVKNLSLRLRETNKKVES